MTVAPLSHKQVAADGTDTDRPNSLIHTHSHPPTHSPTSTRTRTTTHTHLPTNNPHNHAPTHPLTLTPTHPHTNAHSYCPARPGRREPHGHSSVHTSGGGPRGEGLILLAFFQVEFVDLPKPNTQFCFDCSGIWTSLQEQKVLVSMT